MPRSPLPRHRRAATPDARRLVFAAGLLLLVLSYGGAWAADVAAVETGGFGTLHKCRSWLVLQSCHKYDHVAVPDRIGLGDRLDLTFGSNLKEYFFPVEQIGLDHEGCTLYSQKESGRRDIDRIEISPCRPAAATPPSK